MNADLARLLLQGAVCGAALALAVHALATHGVFYALLWIGLTGALGAARAALGDGGTPLLHAFAASATTVYLAGLLAKGFAERSRWKGAILPFVAAHALLAALIAWPAELLVRTGLLWPVTLRCSEALALWCLTGALFGGCYRLISRRTSDNRAKCGAFAALLPAFLGVLELAERLFRYL